MLGAGRGNAPKYFAYEVYRRPLYTWYIPYNKRVTTANGCTLCPQGSFPAPYRRCATCDRKAFDFSLASSVPAAPDAAPFVVSQDAVAQQEEAAIEELSGGSVLSNSALVAGNVC